MELNGKLKEGIQKIGKYRYAILVLVVGLVFMMLPTSKTEPSAKKETVSLQQEENKEDSLSQLLSKVEGAGEVHVMLSIKQGEQTVYQTDDSQSTGTDSGNYQEKTVIISTSDRDQKGLICQVNPEIYLGAIVLCQGADDPAVRLAITEAVSKITGLGADRVVVLKMK